jgi:5-oxoprolinase (ATP-hydrolysing)
MSFFCSSWRQPQDNISDLQAQVAACAVGSEQIRALFDEFGQKVTLFYMEAIRRNAESTVRAFLTKLCQEKGPSHKAVDYMDDGTPIALTVTINEKDGSAVFDFEGTGSAVHGNINAPRAVANAAITYCLSDTEEDELIS